MSQAIPITPGRPGGGGPFPGAKKGKKKNPITTRIEEKQHINFSWSSFPMIPIKIRELKALEFPNPRQSRKKTQFPTKEKGKEQTRKLTKKSKPRTRYRRTSFLRRARDQLQQRRRKKDIGGRGEKSTSLERSRVRKKTRVPPKTKRKPETERGVERQFGKKRGLSPARKEKEGSSVGKYNKGGYIYSEGKRKR